MDFNMRVNEPSRIASEDWPAISRFQNGDRSAFDDLMRRHLQRADKFACQLTKDRDEAADVVAAAFYRAFRSLGRFRGDSSFTSWLYRIEMHCFLDIRKKSRSRATLSLTDISDRHGMDALQVADQGETAHEHLAKRERIAAIEKAIACLPPNQMQAFMMFQAEAMSYEDIAMTLAIPIGTLKSRLNRARLQIRKTIHLHRKAIAA